jgi:topoisomerase-4 subunit A
LLAASNGKGFIVNSDDVIAATKSGKQIMQITGDHKCIICRLLNNGDMVAVIGTNRKLLVFAIEEIPELKRGQGVTLQKYRDAHLSDLKIFNSKEGLSWVLGNKTRLEMQIMSWRAKRGSIGKMPPTGFPKDNKFN